MPDGTEITPLQDVLAKVVDAGEDDKVSVRDLVQAMGERSFGPLLLVPAVILVSPASSIFGLPTIGAIIMCVIALQMLLGRECIWLPDRLQRLQIERKKLQKTKDFLTPAGRVIDRLVYPRLSRLVERPFNRIIAAAIVLITLVMPPLEVILLANTITAAAIGIFALGLTARDGLVILVAFTTTGVGLFYGLRALLG